MSISHRVVWRYMQEGYTRMQAVKKAMKVRDDMLRGVGGNR